MSLFTIFAYQPFKGIFVLGTFVFNLFRLPFWTLKYAFVRQYPAWSFRQALSVRIARAFVSTASVIRIHTLLPLTPGTEGNRFVVIKQKDEDAAKFKGPMLANAATVQPVDIGATWFPAPLTASQVSEDTLVILHLHGGAYVVGDGRTEQIGYLANALLKHTPATHVLSPQYRLSTLPPGPDSSPFPAALQDALTAYLFLLNDLHIPPTNIILSGDSAGGNCAIALLRYIVDFGSELNIPQPIAALIWSPWVDPTDASDSFMHTSLNYTSDYIAPSFTAWGVAAFAGQNPPLANDTSALVNNPYVNLKLGAFKTPVPLFVNVGGAEAFRDDMVGWAEGMGKEGNEVELDVVDGACHDVFLVAEMVGMQETARLMAKRVGEWVRGLSR